MLARSSRFLAASAITLLAACAASPSSDFYQHVNQDWITTHPVPPEYSSYGVFHEIHERNELILREVLEDAAARRKESTLDRDLRLVGTFWASGMDEQAIEALGTAPLAAELARVNAIHSLEGLVDAMAALHQIGVEVGFGFAPEASLVDPQRTILFMIQGGLSLPERDYYLAQDAEKQAIRDAFRDHATRMFALLGEDSATAAADADRVMRLETAIAEISLGAVEMRDLSNLVNELSLADAEQALDNFELRRWLKGLGLSAPEVVNLATPTFFAGFKSVLAAHPLDEWRAYLRLHLAGGMADYLPRAFAEEQFTFVKVLTGQQEMQERWKRVLEATNGAAGEAVGKAYVARAFSPRAKQIAETMVADLLAAYRENLQSLEWMGPETKAEALKKLGAFGVKIGYPSKWQDYSQLRFEEGQYFKNALAAARFNTADALAKIGKPTDPEEWGMTPQTVNAYYHPMRNEIVFPAAILQPPFFDEKMDLASNYGAMGGIIGHEITHGFDDQGSMFDADGVYRMWWTEADRTEFMRRAQMLVDQANAHKVLPGVMLNGELTLGENIADLGGIKMAYRAMQLAMQRSPLGEMDGFSPEQRFFRSWARAWRENSRKEALKVQVSVDPHAVNKFRCNGPLSNLPEFAEAFHIRPGSPMAAPEATRVVIW